MLDATRNPFADPEYWRRRGFRQLNRHLRDIHEGWWTPTGEELEVIEVRLAEFHHDMIHCQKALKHAQRLAWARGAGEVMRQAFRKGE